MISGFDLSDVCKDLTMGVHVLVMQGASFGVDESVRLVPVPEIHPTYTHATEVSCIHLDCDNPCNGCSEVYRAVRVANITKR